MTSPRIFARLSVRLTVTTLLLITVVLSLTLPSLAELKRVGPVNTDPRVGSYPAWYQDKNSLTLEFCNPLNQSEVDGGWCLLLPGDVTIPENFPTNFFDEHFYYAGDAA